MSEKLREEFEAFLLPTWSRKTFVDSAGELQYVEEWVQGAWIGWQGARAAQVVQLPPLPAIPEPEEFAIDDSHMDAYNAAKKMRADCLKAIQHLGLTLEVEP